MSKVIVKLSDFNVSNLSTGQVKLLESGGKACSLSYSYGSTSGPLTTQLGPLSLPYKMNVYDKAGPIKYSMDLSLRGYDEDERVQTIYNALNSLDEWMIDQGVKNSKAWFKADLDRNVIKAFYTPMIKVAKDKAGNPANYPPTVKINLKKNTDGSFDVKTFDSERRPYTDTPLEDLLVKGAKVTTIIQCTSIWFAGSKFGLSWKAKQIRMEAIPESIRDYAFLDEGTTTTTNTKQSTNAQNTFQSLDDEEDEGEVQDDEAFQQPAPVVKKPSALAAMMNPVKVAPAPAPTTTLDEEAEDHEPLPVPTVGQKKTTTVKKMVAKAPVKK